MNKTPGLLTWVFVRVSCLLLYYFASYFFLFPAFALLIEYDRDSEDIILMLDPERSGVAVYNALYRLKA